MTDPNEKNTVSYLLEGEEDDGVIENLIRGALVKLKYYQIRFRVRTSHVSSSIYNPQVKIHFRPYFVKRYTAARKGFWD